MGERCRNVRQRFADASILKIPVRRLDCKKVSRHRSYPHGPYLGLPLADFLELNDFRHLVPTARALVCSLIVAWTVRKDANERHPRTASRAPRTSKHCRRSGCNCSHFYLPRDIGGSAISLSATGGRCSLSCSLPMILIVRAIYNDGESNV